MEDIELKEVIKITWLTEYYLMEMDKRGQITIKKKWKWNYTNYKRRYISIDDVNNILNGEFGVK